MKIQLKRPQAGPPHLQPRVYWKSCEPFVRNLRGKLIHRVLSVAQIDKEKFGVHIHADYLCGSGANSDLVDMTLQFIDKPNGNEIVCHRCEEIAKHSGFPLSNELAGCHVHIGRCIAKADCHDVEVK